MPPPLVMSQAHVNAQTINEASRRFHHEMEWLADIPKETLLQLGLEVSAPQGVLGMSTPLLTRDDKHCWEVSLT
jgi:hypothetical protein